MTASTVRSSSRFPLDRYVYAEWSKARVNIDYHVAVEEHLYSVPHQLIHSVVEICLTAATVEIVLRGQRVWLHLRSPQRGGFTTISEHMPKAHRAHLEWTPSRLIRWAATIGPATAALATTILESRPHPEQGYRSCLGLMRLGKRDGAERLEAAAARALAAGARSYKPVDAILKRGLDRLPVEGPPTPGPSARHHANVRGPESTRPRTRRARRRADGGAPVPRSRGAGRARRARPGSSSESDRAPQGVTRC